MSKIFSRKILLREGLMPKKDGSWRYARKDQQDGTSLNKWKCMIDFCLYNDMPEWYNLSI